MRLLEEPLSAERIVQLLGRLHGFHATWEPALAAVIPERLLQPRLKLPLLQADLHSLGADERLVRTLPACPAAAVLCKDMATGAGSFYVLEGSTLGGRIIDQVLAGAPWYPAAGLRYWNPYREETGKRWKETLDYLESLPPSWSDRIIGSANATFEFLQAWLSPHLPTTGARS